MLVLLHYSQTVERHGLIDTENASIMVDASCPAAILTEFSKIPKLPETYRRNNSKLLWQFNRDRLANANVVPPVLWKQVSQQLLSYLPACGRPTWG